MSLLIQLKSISKSFGPTVIFEGADGVFSLGDKVGVIGRNGAGKTTLCRLILGQEELDGGQIVATRQLRLGCLEQRNPYEPEETVLGFLTRYTGREEWRCGKVAGRFQLKGPLLEEKISDLPGGFQTRVKLAATLLQEPNFLVLDEPTNYLDLRTLVLLEHLLGDFHGGFLIVSHDREFLKRTCLQTLEVERGRIHRFPGDVEAYLAYKEERKEQDVRYNKNVLARRKHLKDFIDRNRVRASTASRAQSKIKQLERLETIEIAHPIRSTRIRVPPIEPKKGVALRLNDLAIGYPGKLVAGDIHFEVERGERVVVLGDNGEGKTTFLRTIAGQLDPRGGEYRWGHRLERSYYAQHVYAALDPRQSVISSLELQASRDVSRQQLLDLAGSFLFRGDDVNKPVSVLSGGERARLCLAGVLLGKRPVLLLDEPTNHLDFETVEALARALGEFTGTVLFTSHDRTFVKLVATSVVEVKGGSVTLYPGDYESYVDRIEKEAQALDVTTPADSIPEKAAAGGSAYEERKRRRSRIKKLRRDVLESERLVDGYEREQAEIHRYYLENPTSFLREKQIRLEELRKLRDDEELRWLSLEEEVERLEREDG